MENEVVQLYLDDIIPNRFQPREVFDDQALKELAISIREHGVIQPILVRKFGEKYEIIAGERRYKASTMAGLTKIPAIVKNLDDKESSKVALIENLQRRDLTPIEEARTYQKILDLDEMTQEALAKTMGKSQSAVSNKLRLLSLPDEIQEALLKEEISERHARSLLNVEDKNVQVELLKEIVANKMSVRELDAKIKNLNGNNSDNNTDTGVSGGTTSGLFVEEQPTPVIENPVADISPSNSNENPPSLFEVTETSNSNQTTETTDSLFGSNTTEVKEEINNESNLFNTNNGVDNMNNDSLFGNNPTTENNDFFQTNVTNPTEVENNGSFFNDPTTVDINKIREQSSDINFNVNSTPSSGADIDSLLGKKEETSSRFIPNFEDTTIEKTEDGNEVIGNGLLAGMPVIQPTDSGSNTNNFSSNDNNLNNNSFINNSFDSSNLNSNIDFTNSIPESNDSSSNLDNNSSLFGVPSEPVQNNDLNSLFGPAPASDITTTEPVTSPIDFVGNNNQNAVNNDAMISSNNVQVAVEDIKKVVQSYKDKGYTVSIEELNLDREIQLIIKLNKN